MRESLLLCLLVVLTQFCLAQEMQEKGILSAEEIAALEADRWRKSKTEADGLFRSAQYEKAAEEYEKAWIQKPTKPNLAYLSGKCYLIIKDYRKATEMLSIIKDDTRRFPKASLLYAQALKQDEQYEMAIEEFESFLRRYEGADAAQLIGEINMEIEGCKIAKAFKDKHFNSSTRIRHLGSVVNTPKTEFAPMPFGTDQLLFSSTKGNGARVFTTSRTVRGWDMPKEASQIVSLQNAENICNTTISPDEKRIYFTICRSEESWGELTTLCQIYVTKRTGNLWSPAEKLPAIINTPGYTTTQPNVVHQGGMEILYFSSNRPEGQGDMDIWYAVRDLSGSDFEYSYPKNLGARINTPANEITPFFDANEGVLYFSSNGHASAGGLDIFSSKGEKSTWDKAENIGFPYNSGADDFFFIKSPYRNDGFLVSNRILGSDKHSTRHEDIFEFRHRSDQVVVLKGSVFNQEESTRVSNVEFAVFEITASGSERFVQNQTFADGRYSMQLEPGKQYKIIADKEGFQPTIFKFTAGEGGVQTEHFYMNVFKPKTRQDVLETPQPVLPEPTTKPSNAPVIAPPIASRTPERKEPVPATTHSSTTTRISSTYQYTPSTPSERTLIETSAPKHSGTYYKVQLSAVDDYYSMQHKFNRLSHSGRRIDTEHLVSKGLTRVLLADFFDKTDALDAIREARSYGYTDAFIVRYVDGERFGRTR